MNNAKKILALNGLIYISEHFDALQDANLLGDSVLEIMNMDTNLLLGFSDEENFFVIKKQENRERIASFARKYPLLFSSLPASFPKAKFLEEVLCEDLWDLELTDEECALGVEFLMTKYNYNEDYVKYIHFLKLRDCLKDYLELDINYQTIERFRTTYDLAEEEVSRLYNETKIKKYVRIEEK